MLLKNFLPYQLSFLYIRKTDEYEQLSFDNLEKNKVKCNPKYGLPWKFMTIVKNMLLKEKILNI